eukprot:TRINITY_DN438_c0_g1_i2.p1 TRINITY_DN438_c0_g1~~TRINITY_DN438_c0_g1_i2.p1  ORF type:complete len:435 (-),score=42.11 TRINITY_DN438_c0_g1_i2:42-1346(-)
MCYSDFPIPLEWPTFLPNKLVAKYFEMYAQHFNLYDYIKFSHYVKSIEPIEENRWKITYQDDKQNIKEDSFDYVLICTGHHWKPRMPNFEGMDNFPGIQNHSSCYKEPYPYVGKKVIVVGIGNSGVDIAVELAQHASEVYLSTRTGAWIIPRIIMGKPLDHRLNRVAQFVTPKRFSATSLQTLINWQVGLLPEFIRPKHSILEAHPTVSGPLPELFRTGKVVPKPNIRRLHQDKSVEFDDGTIVEDIDVIFYCTGYYINFPILDPNIWTDDGRIGDNSSNKIWLWKNMVPPNPKYKNLAFIGLVQPLGAIMPISEMQCRYLLSTLKGLLPPLPSQDEMNKCISKSNQQVFGRYVASPRHTIQVDYVDYMDEFAKMIYCYPSLRELIREYGWDFKFLYNFYTGMVSPLQYRLVGPGKWSGAKKAFLEYCYGRKLS